MNEVENSIHRGIREMAPDLFQQIAADDSPKLTREIWLDDVCVPKRERRQGLWTHACRVAAALAVCCLMLLGGNLYGMLKVDSVVELDVNPSLELQLNGAVKVVRVKALNADGVKILDDLESSLKRQSLTMAVEILVDSMIDEGYISRDKDSVLISVDSRDAAKSAELENRVVDNVRRVLEADQIKGTLYHQSLNGTDETVAQSAKMYGISKGKAAFIQEIRQKDDTLSEGKLASMSMQEITDWLNEQNIRMEEQMAKADTPVTDGAADGDLNAPDSWTELSEDHMLPEETAETAGETQLPDRVDSAQMGTIVEITELTDHKDRIPEREEIPNNEKTDDQFTNQIPTDPNDEEVITDFGSDKDTELVPTVPSDQDKPQQDQDNKPEINDPSDETPGYQTPGGDGSSDGQTEIPVQPEEIPIPGITEADYEGLPVLYTAPLKNLSRDVYAHLHRVRAAAVPQDEAERIQMFEELFYTGNTLELRVIRLDAQLKELHENCLLEDWQYGKICKILAGISDMTEEAQVLLERKFPDETIASPKTSMAGDGCQ